MHDLPRKRQQSTRRVDKVFLSTANHLPRITNVTSRFS